MKSFIRRSVIFFIFSLMMVVGVYLFLHFYTVDTVSVMETVREATSTAVSGAKQGATEVSDEVQAISNTIPEEGVPLSTLLLTESHKKALAAVNIDVETFVLTKEMIVCAGEKVGGERMTEIINGNAPSILEITKLIPCLGA